MPRRSSALGTRLRSSFRPGAGMRTGEIARRGPILPGTGGRRRPFTRRLPPCATLCGQLKPQQQRHKTCLRRFGFLIAAGRLRAFVAANSFARTADAQWVGREAGNPVEISSLYPSFSPQRLWIPAPPSFFYFCLPFPLPSPIRLYLARQQEPARFRRRDKRQPVVE